MHTSRARALKATRIACAKALRWDSAWPVGQCGWKSDEGKSKRWSVVKLVALLVGPCRF